MNRLMENTVFSGFVTAWRLATCPTSRSPDFVNPTTDGVIRLPSGLVMTTGSPPSITATTEFVVPRSMPITFGMLYSAKREMYEQRGRTWSRSDSLGRASLFNWWWPYFDHGRPQHAVVDAIAALQFRHDGGGFV